MLGLPNLGNSCYINSVLQSLRYIRPFVFSIRDVRYNKRHLLNSFIELMFASGDMRHLKEFVYTLSRSNSEFQLLRQCDAHELLLYLLDTLYETIHDLKNIFKGQFESTVTCDACHEESVTHSPFLTVSLDMGKCSVSDLFKQFEMTEVFEGFDCEKCKKKTKASKKMAVSQFPPILILHLKRFRGSEKDQSTIQMERHIVIRNNKYRFIGAINHIGSQGFGHYTATCMKHDDGSFIMCNDKIVKSICLPEESDLPYVLFYQKL